MGNDRKERLDALMDKMPVSVARRWCEGRACACLGCANNSAGLAARGFTKEEWRAWWNCQAEDLPDEPTDEIIDAMADSYTASFENPKMPIGENLRNVYLGLMRYLRSKNTK